MEEPVTPEAFVGARVKIFREIRGWTQQELATRMADTGFPWHQTTVAKSEAADRPIRVNELVRLAAILGVTASDLLIGGTDEAELQALAVGIQERIRGGLQQASEAVKELNEAEREARWIIAEMGR